VTHNNVGIKKLLTFWCRPICPCFYRRLLRKRALVNIPRPMLYTLCTRHVLHRFPLYRV